MDAHKESIEIAIAESGIAGEIRKFGCIGKAQDAFKKALRKLKPKSQFLHFVMKPVLVDMNCKEKAYCQRSSLLSDLPDDNSDENSESEHEAVEKLLV